MLNALILISIKRMQMTPEQLQKIETQDAEDEENEANEDDDDEGGGDEDSQSEEYDLRVLEEKQKHIFVLF